MFDIKITNSPQRPRETLREPLGLFFAKKLQKRTP